MLFGRCDKSYYYVIEKGIYINHEGELITILIFDIRISLMLNYSINIIYLFEIL